MGMFFGVLCAILGVQTLAYSQRYNHGGHHPIHNWNTSAHNSNYNPSNLGSNTGYDGNYYRPQSSSSNTSGYSSNSNLYPSLKGVSNTGYDQYRPQYNGNTSAHHTNYNNYPSRQGGNTDYSGNQYRPQHTSGNTSSHHTNYNNYPSHQGSNTGYNGNQYRPQYNSGNSSTHHTSYNPSHHGSYPSYSSGSSYNQSRNNQYDTYRYRRDVNEYVGLKECLPPYFFTGRYSHYDRLLFNTTVLRQDKWWKSKCRGYVYPIVPRNETITAISITNLSYNSTSSKLKRCSSITEGGVGYKFVKLQLCSNDKSGLNYTITIYGH